MSLGDFDLTGRKAVVTGAGRGIGKGIALVLAEAGADVGVTSLGAENAARVAAAIQALGRRGFGWGADGTSVAAMELVAAEALLALGGLDILVNCIGDSIPGTVAQAPDSDRRVMTEVDWRQVIDINLTQAFVGCHVFGPQLLKQGSGSVINISSFAAIRPGANMTAYAASKAGLTRYTESLALEWAPYRVRVNAIAPGQFPDPDQMSAEDFALRDEQGGANVPLGRLGRMRDVGLASVYLASDASSYVTGQTFAVDGGRTLT